MTKMQEFQRMVLCKELRMNYNLIRGNTYDGYCSFNGWKDPNILKKFSRLNVSEINGSFDCDDNNLISLEGCPKIIKSSFLCRRNLLTSLEHGPKIVGWNYCCGANKLILDVPSDCEIDSGCFINT